MNFSNPIDITGFMDTYDPSQAIKAKSKALGYLNAKAEQGKAAVGGAGLQSVSKLIADQHMADANNYVQGQANKANLFGSAMNLVGGLGQIGAMGGFSGGGPGKMATLDSTPQTVNNAYGSSVSYYDPNIYTGVGDF